MPLCGASLASSPERSSGAAARRAFRRATTFAMRSGDRRLQHVVDGTFVERGDGVLVVGRHEHDVAAAADLAGHLEAVPDGHPDVEERDVGTVLRGERQRFVAVRSLGDDLELRPRGHEARLELRKQERFVFGQERGRHVRACSRYGRKRERAAWGRQSRQPTKPRLAVLARRATKSGAPGRPFPSGCCRKRSSLCCEVSPGPAARLRLRALRCAFSALQRVRVHSVSRP